MQKKPLCKTWKNPVDSDGKKNYSVYAICLIYNDYIQMPPEKQYNQHKYQRNKKNRKKCTRDQSTMKVYLKIMLSSYVLRRPQNFAKSSPYFFTKFCGLLRF